MTDGATDAVTVDARGLRCPAPVLLAARTSRTLPPGSLVTVLATDPATALDLPAWARMRGHETVSVTRTGGGEDPATVRVTLRLGPQTSSASSR